MNEPQTVYVVWAETFYESSDIIGIYASENAAQKAIEPFYAKDSSEYSRLIRFDAVTIVPFVLNETHVASYPTIDINNESYTLHQSATLLYIRELASIPDDHDIWIERYHGEDDVLVESNDDLIANIRAGFFYTKPRE